MGGQWGDEGKGKIVDLLSKDSTVVARYQGGANAGHTVYKDGIKIVLHQIPSGILQKDCLCILGNGMVIDPIELAKEIKELQSLKMPRRMMQKPLVSCWINNLVSLVRLRMLLVPWKELYSNTLQEAGFYTS